MPDIVIAYKAWLGFFLDGIIRTFLQAEKTTHETQDLLEDDWSRIEGPGHSAGLTLRVHQFL